MNSVLRCPLRCPHKTMFGSSLLPVVYRRAHVLFTLFVFVCVQWCPTHIVLCFCFVFLRLCCLFLWIILFFVLPLWYSLTFIGTCTSIKKNKVVGLNLFYWSLKTKNTDFCSFLLLCCEHCLNLLMVIVPILIFYVFNFIVIW